MSLIFDALQRSEGEGAGAEPHAPNGATELLRRAERKAASNWETADRSRGSDSPQEAAAGDQTQFENAAPMGISQERLGSGESSSADDRVDLFPQFQSVPVRLDPQNRLVCFDHESLAAEAFRLLGVRLRHLRRDRPLQKILITSTIPKEGKSMVAANLASTMALSTQHKVLLLEGDLRRPSLSQVFGIGKLPGLSECLQEDRTLTECIYHLENPSLWILPAGRAQNNPLGLLQSRKLSELIDQLAAWFDWIIIDSPPVLPLADTSVWARIAEGILLVTRQGTTEKRHLQRGVEALEAKKLIGGVLNCSRSATRNDYYYGATDEARSGVIPKSEIKDNSLLRFLSK